MAGSLSPCLGGTHPSVSAHWHWQSPAPWTRASSGTRWRSCWSLWFCSSLLCCSPLQPGAGLAVPRNLPKKWICTFKQGEGILQRLLPCRKDAVCRGLNHQTHLLELSASLLCLWRGHKTRGRGHLLHQSHQDSPSQFSCLAFSPKVYAKGFWKQTWIQKQIQVCPTSNGSWLCHKNRLLTITHNRIHNCGGYLRLNLQKNWAAQKKQDNVKAHLDFLVFTRSEHYLQHTQATLHISKTSLLPQEVPGLQNARGWSRPGKQHYMLAGFLSFSLGVVLHYMNL